MLRQVRPKRSNKILRAGLPDPGKRNRPIIQTAERTLVPFLERDCWGFSEGLFGGFLADGPGAIVALKDAGEIAFWYLHRERQSSRKQFSPLPRMTDLGTTIGFQCNRESVGVCQPRPVNERWPEAGDTDTTLAKSHTGIDDTVPAFQQNRAG